MSTLPRLPLLRLGLLACALSGAPDVRADSFFLKDGTKLEGTSEVKGDTTVITTYDGKTVKVLTAEILGSKKDPIRNEYHAKLRALKPDDAAGHFALGEFARKNKLEDEALERFKKTLEIDPKHDGAGQALGYTKKGDNWGPADTGALRIGLSKPVNVNESRQKEDTARALGKQLKALKIPVGAPPENAPEVAALIKQAQQDPDLFIRLLTRPGRTNSAFDNDPSARARAAFILGQAQDRRALQVLLETTFEDAEESVRMAAISALPKLQEPIAVRKLTDAAVDGRLAWFVRKQACLAIRKYGDYEAVDRLLAEVSFELAGGNPRDTKNPLRSGPKGLGTEDPLNMLPNQAPIGPQEDTLIYPALSALKEVTGVTFGQKEKDYKTWRDWWDKSRKDFKFPE